MEEKKRKVIFIKIMVVIVSFWKFLKLSKILKAVFVLKPVITFGSMFLTFLLYSFMTGPQFAFGVIFVLFVHEMGHVAAYKKLGCEFSAPVFIPFFGAVIFSPEVNDYDKEAYMAFGGPFFGAIISYILFFFWWFLPSHPEILLLIAYISIFINLFCNLILFKFILLKQRVF